MKFNIEKCLEQLDAALHNHFIKHNRYPTVVAFNNAIIEQVREHIVDGKYMDIDVYLINSGVVATSIMDFTQLESRGYLVYDGEFYNVYKHPMRKWQHAEDMPKFFDLVYPLSVYDAVGVNHDRVKFVERVA